MYKIVRALEKQGAVLDLLPLLDEPSCAAWLAHQLVECSELPKSIEDRCFTIIEELAKNGDNVDSFVENVWLKEWKAKKGRL